MEIHQYVEKKDSLIPHEKSLTKRKRHSFTWGSDIFIDGTLSEFSQLLEVPILCQRGPPSPTSLQVREHESWSPFDPALPSSIYMVRKDGKDLTVCQVQAMEIYYREKLIPMMKVDAPVNIVGRGCGTRWNQKATRIMRKSRHFEEPSTQNISRISFKISNRRGSRRENQAG